MATVDLESRVAALEAEVVHLKRALAEVRRPEPPWWQVISGTFAGDPMFEEAMWLGREYRESLRPGARDADAEGGQRSRPSDEGVDREEGF